MTDYTPPERVYLDTKDGEFYRKSYFEHEIEYIRADLVEAAKRQGAIEALEAVRKQANGLGWEPLAADYDVAITDVYSAALKAEAK